MLPRSRGFRKSHMQRLSDSLSRRSFLCVVGCALISCRSAEEAQVSAIPVNLGPASAFPEGAKPLEMYRVQIYRAGHDFRAVSMVCTHMTCLLTPTAAGFDCPCHGSKFSDSGKCLSGPARQDLACYELSFSPTWDLLLHLDRKVPPDSVYRAFG